MSRATRDGQRSIRMSELRQKASGDRGIVRLMQTKPAASDWFPATNRIHVSGRGLRPRASATFVCHHRIFKLKVPLGTVAEGCGSGAEDDRHAGRDGAPREHFGVYAHVRMSVVLFQQTWNREIPLCSPWVYFSSGAAPDPL